MMCGKLRNKDKDNIDQDSDVCTIGVRITARRATKQTQNPSNPSVILQSDKLVCKKRSA